MKNSGLGGEANVQNEFGCYVMRFVLFRGSLLNIASFVLIASRFHAPGSGRGRCSEDCRGSIPLAAR